MIESLTLLNLRENAVLLKRSKGEVFILETCQRKLIFGHKQQPFSYVNPEEKDYETYKGESAYAFLLEVACGLRSKIIAENEIIIQFKDALKNYNQLTYSLSQLSRIIEKIFKDTKEIKTEYLTEIGKVSYSSIARKIIATQTDHKRVLIIGSGNLAESTIKIMYKKFDLFISCRNHEKLSDFVNSYGLRSIEWKDFKNYQLFPVIINTIGVSELTLFNSLFFQDWKKEEPKGEVFIDLGEPSAIQTPMNTYDGVYRIKDILESGEKITIQSQKKVSLAQDAIKKIAKKRKEYLALNYTHGWKGADLV